MIKSLRPFRRRQFRRWWFPSVMRAARGRGDRGGGKVELRAADTAFAHHFNLVDDRREQREQRSTPSSPKEILRTVNAGSTPAFLRAMHAFIGLGAFALPSDTFSVNAKGITGGEFRHRALGQHFGGVVFLKLLKLVHRRRPFRLCPL